MFRRISADKYAQNHFYGCKDISNHGAPQYLKVGFYLIPNYCDFSYFVCVDSSLWSFTDKHRPCRCIAASVYLHGVDTGRKMRDINDIFV